MLNAIINWAVPFLFGGAVAFITTLLVKNKAYKDGLRCLLRAEIIRAYDKYTERGEIPIYAKEALEKEYKSYHNLGGNDVATDLYNETMKLKVRK
ncbi:MAG TPA: hypothetical protein DEW35_03490 [Ruminococcaceae bacterium]|nr:hypothetical protein [Oscillospiraceae bacterium]